MLKNIVEKEIKVNYKRQFRSYKEMKKESKENEDYNEEEEC